MNTNTMPVISISLHERPRVNASEVQYIVASDTQKRTPAELWVRTLANDQEARVELLARIMPHSRS